MPARALLRPSRGTDHVQQENYICTDLAVYFAHPESHENQVRIITCIMLVQGIGSGTGAGAAIDMVAQSDTGVSDSVSVL